MKVTKVTNVSTGIRHKQAPFQVNPARHNKKPLTRKTPTLSSYNSLRIPSFKNSNNSEQHKRNASTDLIRTSIRNDTESAKKNPAKRKGIKLWIICLAVIIATAIFLGSIIGAYGIISTLLNNATTKKAMVTTTTQSTLINITQQSDPIIGICSTVAGGSIYATAAGYPINENPYKAIDGDATTKYLNFGNNVSVCSGSDPPGINTGFYITPAINNSVVVGFRFATANDHPNRDPITITIEGSNDDNATALVSPTSWTLIYNGSTGISPTVDPGRYTYVPQQNFSNTLRFSSYRVLVTSKRGTENSVQYSEVQLLGLNKTNE